MLNIIIRCAKNGELEMSGCSFFQGAYGPIIYYQGTFDPIHKGHYAALEVAMAKTRASGAVVVVEEMNPDKPELSPVDLRREMVCRMLEKLTNVFVSTLSPRETKETLFKNQRVISLIGSDICPLYVYRVKSRFDEFCVNLRYLEDRSCPTILASKKVTCVISDVMGVSSSQIKHYLQSHPEVYETGLIESGTQLDQLDSSVLEFILKNKIYLQNKEESVDLREKKMESSLPFNPLLSGDGKVDADFLQTSSGSQIKDLERYLSQQAFMGKPCICTCLSSISSDGEKGGGQSGDLTFLVANEKEKVFVKAYIRTSHAIDCEAESQGMELMGRFSLLWARTLTPIGVWHRSNDSFLMVPYLAFSDLAKIYKNAQEADSIRKFIQNCFCVGRALSELHCHRFYLPQKEAIQEQARILNERTMARLKKLPLHQQTKLRNLFFASYEVYLKNPGMHTYVHGDAILSNFIVDEEERVIFVDVGELPKKRTKEGDPLGSPAEDYYRFLEGIYWYYFWFNKKEVLPISVIQEAQEAFKKGYAAFPQSFTEEAHQYFSNYWKIKNSKFSPKLLHTIYPF